MPSRLLALKPSLKILLIEAGPNVKYLVPRRVTKAVLAVSHVFIPTQLAPSSVTELTRSYANSANLIAEDLDWNYSSTPQTALSNRTIQSAAGKTLRGGSVINTYTRLDPRQQG